MKNKIAFTFIITMLSFLIYGQNDYYSLGSSTTIGIKIKDMGDQLNARICRIQTKDSTKDYSPDEVAEYGFKDGRVYFSKKIPTEDSMRNVFLERLEKGRTSLFYYHGKGIKTFFVSKGDTLFVEVPKLNKAKNQLKYREQLKRLTADYYDAEAKSNLVSYTKKSMTKFIKGYNTRNLPFFTFFRFGIMAGAGMKKLDISSEMVTENIGKFEYKFEKDYTIGAFVNNPLSRDFSLQAELYYSVNHYSYNFIAENIDVDFLANISGLSLPILIRYSLPFNKLKPFVNAGGCFVYNLKTENSIYQANIAQNVIEILPKEETSYVAQKQFGYCLGAGLEVKLNYRRSLFFELRYNRALAISQDKLLNSKGIHLFTGINF